MTPIETNRIYPGDVLDVLRTWPADFVQTVVTSPPYWNLRDYGVTGQLGLEPTPEEYVAHLVGIFEEIKRVLRPDGTLWVNIGDTYNSGPAGARDPFRWPKQHRNDHQAPRRTAPTVKPKDLVGIPWRLAFALQAAGWYLRADIIWSKPNPMPESVRDRPTKSHEYVFLLAKSRRYFYNASAVREPIKAASAARLGRNATAKGSTRANGGTRADRPMKAVAQRWPSGWDPRENGRAHRDLTGRYPAPRTMKLPRFGGDRAEGHIDRRKSGKVWEPDQAAALTANKKTVWSIPTQGFKDAHFATFPERLAETCIRAGTRTGGGDIVLDPFLGAGTTAVVAKRLLRPWIGIEIAPKYVDLAQRRIDAVHDQLLTEK